MKTIIGVMLILLTLIGCVQIEAGGIPSSFEASGIYNAAQEGDLIIVQQQLSDGVDVNDRDLWGFTPLAYAAQNGHVAVVKRLISSHADVNKVCGNVGEGLTALMQAARHGRAEVIEPLLTAGANINAQDKDGWTALMYAVKEGKVGVVKELLAADADVGVKNMLGQTAFNVGECTQNIPLELFGLQLKLEGVNDAINMLEDYLRKLENRCRTTKSARSRAS